MKFPVKITLLSTVVFTLLSLFLLGSPAAASTTTNAQSGVIGQGRDYIGPVVSYSLRGAKMGKVETKDTQLHRFIEGEFTPGATIEVQGIASNEPLREPNQVFPDGSTGSDVKLKGTIRYWFVTPSGETRSEVIGETRDFRLGPGVTYFYGMSATIPTNARQVEIAVICEAAWNPGTYAVLIARFNPSTPPPSNTTPPVNTVSASFSDLPSHHWAYASINAMVQRGILKGYPDGTFKPGNMITRAEFAKILVQSLVEGSTRPAAATYRDVPLNHWAFAEVESSRPYIAGFQNTATGEFIFYPAQPVLREDVAAAIVRAMGFGNATANPAILNQLPDHDQISPGLRNLVAVAMEKGYMQGTNLGFEPKKGLTRAEACTLLARLLQ